MTPKLSDPWGAYLRLQADLDATGRVNNRSWGMEAGLDAILDAASAQDGSGRHSDLKTTIDSARRRERHRARLRRIYAADLEPTVDQPAQLDARIQFAPIRRALSVRDWQLISRVADGMEYQAIARTIGGTPGSLRVRTLRIRQALRKLAA